MTAVNSVFRDRFGPWAVVTGASSGIGREVARLLAGRGLDIVLVARRGTALRELAAEIRSAHGTTTIVVESDLETDRGIHVLESATAELDVGLVVAAAGFGTSGPFLAANLDEELPMVMVNCLASLQQAHHFGRRMATRGRGAIVLISSIVAWQGVPMAAHYAATKAHPQALAEGIVDELGSHGVDVLVAAPGPVHIGFAPRAGMKLGRAMEPADVAAAIVRSIGRRGTIAPGWLSAVLSRSLGLLPRSVRTRMMGRMMRGMTGGA
ncbi:MAG: SDR family NAD(P)-dependent oxidoreductase [Candidatus Limnocylindria bacterium]